MHQVLAWIDVATYVFLGITLLCLWRMKRQLGDQRNTGLLARIAGGLVLCSIGTTIILPRLASPRSTVTGVVRAFHEVKENRGSHFEFRIEGNNQLSGELRANYFDKGFYFDDPSVSNGDTVEAAYLNWTNEVIGLREVAGRHAGWTFQEDQNRVGPWLLIFGGGLLVFTGIFGKLSDLAAKPEGDPAT
jgi:hypothetical protein